ncbi:MAG: translation initiation factor IF-2 [Candidatus Diapherotrites archaeon]
MIRTPIITVMGHVDAGKTRLLDTIRGTSVSEKEAGGITQHIGATEVPMSLIEGIAGNLIHKFGFNITIPGLLFIDTPGHEAFTNLRKRGGSIADLAVVVVDIHKGLQNQTIEAIEILKSYKTPFIIAANKIDRIFGWQTEKGPFSDNIERQPQKAKDELDKKIYELVGQLHSKGFSSERFDRCSDFTKEIPIIPTCAKFGEGIPEVLVFLAGLSQKYLEKKLSIHVKGRGKGTILEVKEEKGLGTTIDVIVYDGTIKVGEEIIVGGRNGTIVTKIRALLEPRALDEIRNPQEKFKSIKEIHAAAGVKIAAPMLDDAIAGSPVRVVGGDNDEKEILEEMQSVKIESDAIGPVVRADTLGSLEAFVKLLAERGIKVKKADIGDLTRRDIMELESVKEKDQFRAVGFAFHTKATDDALDEAKKGDVKILEGNIIYKLLEDYDKWVEEEKNKKKQEAMEKVIMPVKIKIIPGFIFRNTKPAVVGVRVLVGKLRTNIEIMKDGKIIGRVHAIQSAGKNLSEAKEGEEVAVSISGIAMVGRNINEKDELISFIPKKQFDKIKELEDSLSDKELSLMEEIKKIEKDKELIA